MRYVTTLAVALVAFASVAVASPASDDREFTRTIAVSGPVALDASTLAGGVTVTVGRKDAVVVRGTIHVRPNFNGFAVTQEQIERLRRSPPVKASGGSVALEQIADENLRRAVAITYEVEVPEETAVTIRTESGRVAVDGVRGAVDVESGSGGVDVSRVGGDVSVKTGSGAASVAHGGGNVRVTSRSGAVTVDGVKGSLDAKTDSSAVDVAGKPAADWTVASKSGRLKLRVPYGSAFDIAAHSRSGNVSTKHEVAPGAVVDKHRLEGRVGAGGATLALETGSSAITVE